MCKNRISVYRYMSALIFFISGLALAQNYSFENIGVKEGLSQSSVNSIAQDKEGYIWFGTSNGLNRFDGYEFKIFRSNKADSTTISNDAVTALFVDNSGSLWVGTTDGKLNRYISLTGSFKRYNLLKDSSYSYLQKSYYDYPLPISRNNETTVTSITEDNDGFLWIGTWGRGLIRFDKRNGGSRLFTYDPQNPLSINFNRITKVLVDRLGVIWVGTFGGGLNKIIKSLPISPSEKEEILFYNFSHIPNDPNSISDNIILTLYEDSNSDLWIGTYNSGLDRFDFDRRYLTGKAAKFVHFSAGSSSGSGNSAVMSIIQSSDGFLWVGKLNSGLYRYDYSTKEFLKIIRNRGREYSVENDDILSLFEDTNGTLWIGTHLGRGISLLKKKPYKFNKIVKAADSDNGLNDNIVWAILKDSGKNLWVGTYRGGINLLTESGNWERILPGKNSINDSHIRSFAEDKYGNIWIGTYSGGINFFDKKTRKFYNYPRGENKDSQLPSNQIQTLFALGDTLWIGTFGGGLRYLNLNEYYSNRKFIVRVPVNISGERIKTSDDRIYTIAADSSNNLCVGAFGGGLNIISLTSGSISYVKSSGLNGKSLNNNKVISLLIYSRNQYYVGTYGGGINIYNPADGSVKYIRPPIKNVANAIYGMVKDNSGRVWLSTDNGIYKYNPNDGSFLQYNIYDGLQSMEFSGGAYFKDSEGEIYFGGTNGLNYFHPDSIVNNSYIPPIVITGIKIFDKEITGLPDKLTLSDDENFVSIKFSSLDYTSPSENKYAFILNGFEDEWHFVGSNNRIASYTNLPPGEYTFVVKGTNNDGLWNEKGASVELTILPPFYTTWWFIALTVILILGTAGLIITLRIRQLLVIEKIKSGLAADLHDDIGAGLTEISILSELAAGETEKHSIHTANKIKIISDRARQLVDSMSDIVWFINPGRDSLYDLVIRLKDSYADTLHQMGIQFQTVNLDKIKNLRLPVNHKQNLFLIFKESINNAIKHSRCKKIIFEADMIENKLVLSLFDDGSGFDAEKQYSGNGLGNIQKRAAEIEGKLEITTGNSTGTKIVFIGKLKKRFKLFDRN